VVSTGVAEQACSTTGKGDHAALSWTVNVQACGHWRQPRGGLQAIWRVCRTSSGGRLNEPATLAYNGAETFDLGDRLYAIPLGYLLA